MENQTRSHQFAVEGSEWALETTSGPEPGWEKAHTPLPNGMCDTWVWLPKELHLLHGIYQSEDVGRRCYWNGDVAKFFREGPFVDNWFELYDLFEKWTHTTPVPAGWNHTDEARKNMSKPRENGNGRKGAKCSKETIAKMRAAKKGKPSPRKGVPNSPEAIERIKAGRNRVTAQKKLRSMAATDPLLGAFWD